MRKVSLWTCLMVCVLVSASAQETPRWETIVPPLSMHLPRDHGAHLSFRTEWWYVTGEVADGEGRSFGYQLTIFRNGLDIPDAAPGGSRLRPRHVLAGHLAIADIREGRFRHAERLRRVAAGMAGVSEKDLHAWIEDWEMTRGEDGIVRVAASDRAKAMAIKFELIPGKPLVFHGDGGYSAKGPQPGNGSAYLSFTRMGTVGTLEVDGRVLKASGESWFDHEWGTSQLGEDLVGWDWFGLRLEDGRELMLYHLRRSDGTPTPQSSGTLIERDGSTRRLSLRAFSLEVLSTWASPRSQAVYPSRWRVRIPSAALDIEIAPKIADAELDSTASTGVVYWEGPVSVKGSVKGSGYGELTGYAGSMAKKF